MAYSNNQYNSAVLDRQEHPYAGVVQLGAGADVQAGGGGGEGGGGLDEWGNREDDAGSRDASEGHGSFDSSQDRPTLTLNQDSSVSAAPSAPPPTGPLSVSGAEAPAQDLRNAVPQVRSLLILVRFSECDCNRSLNLSENNL